MIIAVDESGTGTGKTHRVIDYIISSTKMKVLFVTERTQSFHEIKARIVGMASAKNSCPIVSSISSETDSHLSVSKQIKNLPSLYATADHVVVIITHAALIQSDFSAFAGWQIVIDEVPNFIDFEEKRTHLDQHFFDRHYRLTPLAGGWSAVSLTMDGERLSVADLRSDDSHAHLHRFHSCVRESNVGQTSRYVLTNICSWNGMSSRSVKWAWASVFSMSSLAAFDQILVLGNRFRNNIGAIMSAAFETRVVEWESLPSLNYNRPFRTRAVRIHYFSERPASKTYFGSLPGQAVLREIGSTVSKRLVGQDYIWTANRSSDRQNPSPATLLNLEAARYLPPKQAGTNLFQHVSAAVAIYTAKPSTNLRSLMLAFDIDPSRWTDSVEYETILQFMTRTSVRDPDSSQDLDMFVFDRNQANYLAGYFRDLAHLHVSISQVALEADIPERRYGGRPRLILTPEEEKARQDLRRRKDAERKRRVRAQKKKVA